MEPKDMTLGRIVCEPELKSMPENQRFFRVLFVHDEAVGPWDLEQVWGRSVRTVRLGDLERFEPVPAEVYMKHNFEGLIGKRVVLETHERSKVAGTVVGIAWQPLVCGAVQMSLPRAIMLDGDEFDIRELRGIYYGDSSETKKAG